jgi:hypothetical protein
VRERYAVDVGVLEIPEWQYQIMKERWSRPVDLPWPVGPLPDISAPRYYQEFMPTRGNFGLYWPRRAGRQVPGVPSRP